MTAINPYSNIPRPNQPIIPRYKEPTKQVPLDPAIIGSVISPFDDFASFKRKHELKKLRELEEIWAFLQCKQRGPILDIYFYLKEMVKENSKIVQDTANNIIEYLDSTRMRGS